MKKVNSRERVLAAVKHKKPDRTPLDYWARKDVTGRIIKFLGAQDTDDLYRRLGIDLRKIPINENHPDFESRAKGILGGSSESSGSRYIFHENGCFEDAWGIVRRLGSNGLYDEWITGPFAGNTDLDSYTWPELSIFDAVETLRTRVSHYNGEYATMGRINLPFKVAWHMRGLENFLCDLMTEVSFAKELLQRVAVYETEKGLRFIRSGVDIVGIYGDIAMQRGMLIGPEVWRSVEKPILEGMIRSFRRENPNIKIFFHSDGDISKVLPDLIEAGVDIINPVQPECMNPVKVKEEYGDRITMHGTISIQRTLPNGTVEDVRREVTEMIKACGYNGGLILCPSNLIQNDTPLENIIAMYEAAATCQ